MASKEGDQSDQSLPQGGYDVDFIEPLSDNLECPVCLLAVKEPNILSCCGIKVCYSCIDQITTGGKGCPVCREPSFTIMLEKQMCRLVLDLKVYCQHKSKGCDWTGELRDLDKHLESACKYVTIICQFGCGAEVIRCEVNDHEIKDCLKRPLERQLYQLREIIEGMKEEHVNEVSKLREVILVQGKEIDALKSRMDALEQSNNVLTKTLDSKGSSPPIPPPPPPIPSSSAPPAPPPPPIQSAWTVPIYNTRHSFSRGGTTIPHQSHSVCFSSLPARPPPPPPPAPPFSSTLIPPGPPPAVFPPSTPPGTAFTIELNNSRRLFIVKGDVCLQNVDVVACSAGRNLKHTAGVSLALNRASFGEIQRHSDRLLLHSGDLTYGDVVSTPAGGQLKCSHVVLAIPPLPKYFTKSDFKLYKALITKCLAKVESLNVRSVAFSAIGSTVSERRPDLVASAMIEAISGYSYSSAKLIDLRIVVLEQKVYNGFEYALEERKQSRGIVGRVTDYLYAR